MAVFDRGDIVRVGLDPVVGHEMRVTPGARADNQRLQSLG